MTSDVRVESDRLQVYHQLLQELTSKVAEAKLVTQAAQKDLCEHESSPVLDGYPAEKLEQYEQFVRLHPEDCKTWIPEHMKKCLSSPEEWTTKQARLMQVVVQAKNAEASLQEKKDACEEVIKSLTKLAAVLYHGS